MQYFKTLCKKNDDKEYFRGNVNIWDKRRNLCRIFHLLRIRTFWQTSWLSPDRSFTHLYQVFYDFLLQSHPSIAHLMAIAKRALLWIQIDSFKHNWQGTHSASQVKKQLGPDFVDVLCCIKNMISPRLGCNLPWNPGTKWSLTKLNPLEKKSKAFSFFAALRIVTKGCPCVWTTEQRIMFES